MTWLALLACTAGTADSDSGTTPDSVTGTLTATPGTDMVTTATVTASLSEDRALSLICTGDGTHLVPETHRWSATGRDTSHTAALHGLLADTTYTCEAEGLDEVASVSFTTGSLPASLQTHQPSLETWEPDASVGWTLTTPTSFYDTNDHRDVYLVVLDMAGQVRWYVAAAGQGTVAFDYNVAEQAFWTGGGLTQVVPPITLELDGRVRHATTAQADHDVDWVGEHAWTLTNHISGTCIEQRRWSDNTVIDLLCTDELGLRGLNWNSLDVLEEPDGHAIYAGSAGSDTIVKVHFERRETVWVFGPGQDFSGQIDLSYTHDVNAFACDGYDVCLSFYDNGTDQGFSQAEVHGLDEAAMRTRSLQAWSEDGWYEPRLGGLQVLDGGNLLVGAGHLEEVAPGSNPTNLVEVADDGSVLWRVTIGPNTTGIYRARRVPACDLFHHTGYCPDPR